MSQFNVFDKTKGHKIGSRLFNVFDKTKGHKIGSRLFNFPTGVLAVTPAITWDPDNKGPDMELSLDKLTITTNASSADWEQTIATLGRSSGKYYFEVLVTAGSSVTTIGVQNGSESFETHTGDTFDGWGYMGNARFYNSAYYGMGITFANGDIIGVAVDLDNGYVWWSKNGVWVDNTGSPDPATGTDPAYSNLSGTMYPAASVYLVTEELTGRFKLSDFSYTPPTGFSAWED